MKALINVRIYDYERYIELGYVIFDQKILEVGEMKNFSNWSELPVEDGRGLFLIPGLVNGHTHIYSTLFRGSPLNVLPNNFLEILSKKWWKFDKELTLPTIKESALGHGRSALLSGVTSLIDHHASGEIIGSLQVISKELENLGIKHILCFETSDRFDVNRCISENLSLGKLRGHFGLHASLSLSDETLKSVSYVLDRPIHIHVAESNADEILTQERYGKKVVERLDEFGLLLADSILAHCVHINDDEAQIIKDRNCQIAINPTSNTNNAVGIYNNKLLQEKAIPVLVGTDGLGSNIAKEYQYLYYLGNQSNNHPSKVSLDWIKAQIENSYNYFNRVYGCKIGRIKKGYDSDFILFKYESITPINDENIFAHLLFGMFEALKPDTVYTSGKKRVDEYRVIGSRKVDSEVVENLWRCL